MTIRIVAGLLLATLVASACTLSQAAATPDPLGGDYLLRGGGGALDAVTALTTAFHTAHPEVVFIGFEDIGSDASVKLIADRNADLGFISRDLKPAEIGTVATLPIGRSGTAIAVNASNPVKGVTKDQLRKIYSGEITDWAELGGTPGKIRIFVREPTAPVRTAIESYVFGSAKPTYPNAVEFHDGGSIINSLVSFPTGIGMLGMSSMTYGASGIKLLTLDGVPATRATVADGTYKILRPLYLVYDRDPAKVRPGIKAFLDFVRSPAGQQVLEGL